MFTHYCKLITQKSTQYLLKMIGYSHIDCHIYIFTVKDTV